MNARRGRISLVKVTLWMLFPALSFGDLGMDGLLDIAAGIIGCGVVHEKGVVKKYTSVGCHEPMAHNCVSMKQLPRLCHDPACPFVAPHTELRCVFSCTADVMCSKVNPEFAYPNKNTSVCERCGIVGCRICSSPDRCAQCFNNFRLANDGQFCTYEWDEHAENSLALAVPLVLAFLLLVFATLTVVDYCACCGRCLPQEAPPEGEDALEEAVEMAIATGDSQQALLGARQIDPLDPLTCAVNQGKRHRLCCKVKDLEILSDDIGATRWRKIPFTLNLRSRFLAGVGLPLFHQWYYFLFLYSLLMAAGTAWVYYGSNFDSFIQRAGVTHASKLMDVDSGSITLCGIQGEREQIWHSVQDFAWRASVGYLILWFLGLCLSLAHAARQRRIVREFYLNHASLAEFALNVEGFPPDATDEEKIRTFLREVFGNEDLEVSVCYDFRDRKSRVRKLLEKVLVRQDVQAGTYDASLGAGVAGWRGLGLSQEEKAEVRGWVEPGRPQSIQNAGSVFAVFPHNYDLQTARQRFADNRPLPRSVTTSSRLHQPPAPPPMLPHSPTPEWLSLDRPLRWVGSDGRMHNLIIRDVVCEPPEIVWEHLGERSTFKVFVSAVIGYGMVALSFAFLAAVVFVPLAQYSLSYMHQAGSAPTGLMMTLLGLLTMAATWLVLLLHIRISSSVGFSRKDREGIMVFQSWTIQCMVCFLFNVAISIFPQMHGKDPSTYLFQDLSSNPMAVIQDISFQVRTAAHLFHVLIPGGLFLGYLLFPLQGFVWPFVSTLSIFRAQYGWNFGPQLTAREAELALEPLGMSLGHDYMGHIYQPISCTLVLFFASGKTWQTFVFLALWAIFMMVFSRYIHLRATRRSFFTTNRVDSDALFFWGVPLSMVLAASCFWAAKLYSWPMWTVAVSFFAAFTLYVVVLAMWIQPISFCKDECHAYNRPSYNEVRARRFYDWNNCNPIKVLLSHCSESGQERPIIPFEVGKEYLQAKDPQWRRSIRFGAAFSGDLVSRPNLDSMESVDSVNTTAGFAAWCCLPTDIPEVETLIENVSGIGRRWNPQGSKLPRRGSEKPALPEQAKVDTPRNDAEPKMTKDYEQHSLDEAAEPQHSAAEGLLSATDFDEPTTPSDSVSPVIPATVASGPWL